MSDHRRSQNAHQGRTGIDKTTSKKSLLHVDKILEEMQEEIEQGWGMHEKGSPYLNPEGVTSIQHVKSALKKDIESLMPSTGFAVGKSDTEIAYQNGRNSAIDEIKEKLGEYFGG